MMKIHEPEQFGMSSKRLQRIDTIMQSYVDSGKLAGISTGLIRKGHLIHLSKCGWQDIEAQTPLDYDTIFRIYSMTKPITSIALMMLYEQGRFHLQDAVSKYIPEFAETRVIAPYGKLEKPSPEMTIQDLLRHTSGISYLDFYDDEPIVGAFVEGKPWASENTLQDMIRRLVKAPLVYQPGTQWSYSAATNVVGYLVEVLSGSSLGDFFEEHIFQPLGMVDTLFRVPEDKLSRFATLYGDTKENKLDILTHEMFGDYVNTRLHYGGGGLVSTLPDYLRFAKCLLNKGDLDGFRLIGRKTLEMMAINHLPENVSLPSDWLPGFGFGLGFSVVKDVAATGEMGSVGNYGWGGWASTNFWVDPQEDLTAVLMLQYIPDKIDYPVRADFRTAVYQALND